MTDKIRFLYIASMIFRVLYAQNLSAHHIWILMRNEQFCKFFSNYLQSSEFLFIFAEIIEIMTKSAALSKIRQTATSTIPDGGKAILYGSRARGDNRKDSDWDILILLDKDTLDQSDYDNVSYPFVLLGCDLGVEINPIMYTTKEWESYRITPFYENVVRDGIVLV